MSNRLTRKIILISSIFICGYFLFSCKSKQKTSAQTLSSKDEKDNTVKVKSLFYNACREKIKGNPDIAEQLFRECIKLDPFNNAAKYELGNLYRFSGLYDMALKFSKEAAIAEPSNEWYQLLYIECLHNKRLYDEAATSYERLINYFPNKYDFYRDLATEYVYAGKPDKAIKVYNDISHRFGVSPSNSLEKIKLLKQLKRWIDAETELKLLIKENPNEAEFYTLLAELYQETNQNEKAYNTYREILLQDPENPYVHLALADYYRQQKMDEEFFKEIKFAFKSDQLDVDNKVKILVSYYLMTEQYPQHLKQAYELCQIFVQTSPTEPKAHSVYGDFLFRDKKLVEARKEFETVILYDKERFAVWNQLMICESELADYSALLTHSTEAIELFPTQPSPYFFNGLALLKQKNYTKAIQSLKDGKEFVLENDPLIGQFASTLGEAYHANQEYEKSDKEFDEALLFEPNNDLLMNNYAYYLSLRSDKLEKAEKLSKRSLEINSSSPSFMDTYGWILFKQTKYSDAKIWIEKAMKNGGDNRPALLEHYGDILFMLGDEINAMRYWELAIKNGGASDALKKKIKDKKYYE